jgi:pSer/pThr/pTyr-binding forkhead associated (FHA) protein
VTLGRSSDNTIPLNSRGVSRQHAQIERTVDGNIVITDRNSSNGTFLDGQRITRAVLREGSSFQIGPFVIRVSFSTPTQQEQAATPMELAPNLGAAVPVSVNQNEATLIFQQDGSSLDPGTPPTAPTAEVFPPAGFQQPFVSVQQLHNSGLPIT